MSKMTAQASFFKVFSSKLSQATSGASFRQNYKNRLFWRKLMPPDLATHRSRCHFLVFFCVSDSEPLKCDVLRCVARSARDGVLPKKGLKMRPKAQKSSILRYIFFRCRFLILSRKPAQITQFR